MNITLFRGDREFIPAFNVANTNKFCYRGKGIYLTDSQEVADTYRRKGDFRIQGYYPTVLFSGTVSGREEALSKAFPLFLSDLCLQRQLPSSKENLKKMEEPARLLFKEMLDQGKIKVDYVSFFGNTRTANVKCEWPTRIGYVTKFVFARQEFEPTVLHVDKPIRDPFVWEILWEHKLGLGKEASNRENYLRANLGVRLDDKIWKSPNATARLRNTLSRYGFRGFEYDGGVATGSKRHRAFVLWDSDYVNDHIAQRF